MENATESVLDTLFALAVALFLLSFYVLNISIGNRGTELLADRMGNKASSNYSLAYITGDNLVTASEAYSDVLTEVPDIEIQVNGSTLDKNILKKARNHNTDSIRWLKRQFNTTYQKVLYYDTSGNIVTINYIPQ